MVRVGRLRQAEQRLEQSLDMRRCKNILTAGDERHALIGIVDDDREMVGGRRVLARKDDVSKEAWVDGNRFARAARTLPLFVEVERSDERDGFFDVQPQRVRRVAAFRALLFRQRATRPRADGPLRPMRRFAGARDLLGDFGARAEARIDETACFEARERVAISINAFRLPQYRPLPVQAQPCQVLEDRLFEFGPRTRRIDVLDPDDELSAFGRVFRKQRRVSVPEVQISRWTWRETRDNHRLAGAFEMTKPKRITSAKHLANGLAELVGADKRLAKIAAIAGPLAFSKREGGFEALLSIVASQQLSAAAADTIFARLKQCIAPFEPEVLLAASDTTLRDAGLSAPKQRHMRSVATRMLSRELDLEAISRMSDEDAHAHLTDTPGIGPWTADIYLMSYLGRADIWPVGDVALQAAVGRALRLKERPDIDAMLALGERWRPWRTIAARLFWTHYRVTQESKKRHDKDAKAAKKARRA